MDNNERTVHESNSILQNANEASTISEESLGGGRPKGSVGWRAKLSLEKTFAYFNRIWPRAMLPLTSILAPSELMRRHFRRGFSSNLCDVFRLCVWTCPPALVGDARAGFVNEILVRFRPLLIISSESDKMICTEVLPATLWLNKNQVQGQILLKIIGV